MGESGAWALHQGFKSFPFEKYHMLKIFLMYKINLQSPTFLSKEKKNLIYKNKNYSILINK